MSEIFNNINIPNLDGFPKIEPKIPEHICAQIEYLKSGIIGQDEIISQVVLSLNNPIRDINKPNQPLHRLLFFGPTGVGKTELARGIAQLDWFKKHNVRPDQKYLDPSWQDNLLHIDCGMYQQGHEVATLTGAPPSYVGRDQKPILARLIADNAPNVILVDEVEKARGIVQEFLAILDDGKILLHNQQYGKEVTFANKIIIFTSNAGSAEIAANALARNTLEIGFAREAQKAKLVTNTGILLNHFPPEFLGRLNLVTNFNSLDLEQCMTITRDVIYPKYAYTLLTEHNIGLTMTSKAMEAVTLQGYDPVTNARSIEKAFRQNITDKVALLLPRGSIVIGTTLHVDHSPEQGFIFKLYVNSDIARLQTEIYERQRQIRERSVGDAQTSPGYIPSTLGTNQLEEPKANERKNQNQV